MKWPWQHTRAATAERQEAEARAEQVRAEVIWPLREMRQRNHLTEAIVADIHRRLKESSQLNVMLASEIAIRTLFWAALAFIAVVSTFWPWWKSQLGWTVIAKSLALAIAVFPAMLAYWFGSQVYADVPWLQWVSVIALWAVPPILAWRALVIWQLQRKARNIL